ncbi:hypothetical protein A8C85_000132 [Escherichia coli]|nr:hypothetical protein [Escherichia coli]EES9562439.1 hypothetical protein [Escherichia coli]EET9651142.1 hypothetical protein [Escherichia coli]EEV9787862.1 hypothetical protein [Escherichia coli]EEW1326497.1 hypothetical protein [Escherichia coli]
MAAIIFDADEFPAPAGINRTKSLVHEYQKGVPRASGDKPPSAAALNGARLSSPRQRG